MPPMLRALAWAAMPVVAALSAADAVDRVERVFDAPPATPVSVRITVGNVDVRAWDRHQIEVQVTRRAPERAQLERLEARVEQDADGVQVRALQADEGRDARFRTDVALRVPAGTVLRRIAVFEGRVEVLGVRGACDVLVERGDITVREPGGALRLETLIGNVRVERGRVAADAPLRLRTFNGDVDLELAGAPSDARILALSMGGGIVSDIPLSMKTGWGPRFGETTLGRGEPLVSLEAVNGDVSIRVRK
jgi:hypothetical protein